MQTKHIHIHTAVIEYYFNDFLGKQAALVTRLAVQIIEVVPVFTSGIYVFNEYFNVVEVQWSHPCGSASQL